MPPNINCLTKRNDGCSSRSNSNGVVKHEKKWAEKEIKYENVEITQRILNGFQKKEVKRKIRNAYECVCIKRAYSINSYGVWNNNNQRKKLSDFERNEREGINNKQYAIIFTCTLILSDIYDNYQHTMKMRLFVRGWIMGEKE